MSRDCLAFEDLGEDHWKGAATVKAISGELTWYVWESQRKPV